MKAFLLVLLVFSSSIHVVIANDMKRTLPKRRMNWVDCIKAAGCGAAVAGACAAGWEVGACVAAMAVAGTACSSSVQQCGHRRLLSVHHI